MKSDPRIFYTPYNETPTTKGPVMFKDKIAKLKKKMKDNPELTALFASATVITTATVVAVPLILKKAEKVGKFEPDSEFRLEEITGETREKLLSDENFALLKLTDDEFMYCRQPNDN